MFLDVPLNAIQNNIVPFHIIKLLAIDSTNSYLKKMAKETHLADLTVAVADSQHAGRGQMGNSWYAKEGQSLTFSVFKRFDELASEHQFRVTMAVSLAVIYALQRLNVPNLTIKWPNDILSANKKIGGILIESVLEGQNLKYAIIGIGLNVNNTDLPQLPQASSLKLATGNSFQKEEVLEAVLAEMFTNFQENPCSDFYFCKTLYEANLFRRGVVSVFETPAGIRFNGIIKGVSEMGELLVETENGPLQKFQMKEVKMIY